MKGFLLDLEFNRTVASELAVKLQGDILLARYAQSASLKIFNFRSADFGAEYNILEILDYFEIAEPFEHNDIEQTRVRSSCSTEICNANQEMTVKTILSVLWLSALALTATAQPGSITHANTNPPPGATPVPAPARPPATRVLRVGDPNAATPAALGRQLAKRNDSGNFSRAVPSKCSASSSSNGPRPQATPPVI